MSSPSPWNYEEDTGRWYMWDEAGQKHYEQELHQGSAYSSTQQPSYQDSTPRTTHVATSSRQSSSRNPHHRRESVSYSSHGSRRESRRDPRPHITTTGSSTSGRQSGSYYDRDQGNYGASQASQPSQASGYGSPVTADYQTNPGRAQPSQGYNVTRSNVPSGVAFSPSVTDRMGSLSMNESSKSPAYIASAIYPLSSTAYTATPSQTFASQTSYSAAPVFPENKAPRVASDQYSTPYQGESSVGMSATPQTDKQTSQSLAHRHVAGTPGDEKLNSKYQIRNLDYKKFFKPGRVFSTLWTVPASNTTNNNETFISYVKYGEPVHTKIRRFVVVNQRTKHCTCLPVTSYGGLGYKKPNIEPDEHGPIYSSKRPRSVPKITKKALKVSLSKGAEPLRDTSLINYCRMYTVEMNVKVMDVGILDPESLELLEYYYHEVNYPIHTSSRPQRDDMDLAGVGTGLSSGSQAGGYAPSGSDRVSGFGSGGYNTNESHGGPIQGTSGYTTTTTGYNTRTSMTSTATANPAPVSNDRYVTSPSSSTNTRYAATERTPSITYSETETSTLSPRSEIPALNYTTQPPYPTTQSSTLYPPYDNQPSITPRGSDTYPASASHPAVGSYRSSTSDQHPRNAEDDDEIDLPTREEVEASRSSRSHISRPSRRDEKARHHSGKRR